jgi:uncharacterized protein YjdB
MKKWIAFMLIFALSFVFFGCDDDPGKDEVAVRSVAIEDSVANMEVGEEVQLKAVITPAEAVQTVKWTSDKEEVATVSETGLVKAVGAGTVTITATSTVNNRASRSVTILVTEPIVYEDPTSVEIVARASEFRINSFITLEAKVHPLPDSTKGTHGAIQTVTWESDNEEVATINSSGRVTGLSLGKAVIKATSVVNPLLFATFEVTVTEGQGGEIITQPEEIRISGENKVEEGYQIALIASVLPSGVSQNVTWSTETPELISVSSTGIVKGLKAGTAYVKVVSNVDFSVERLYEITVLPEVPEPDPTDMKGYEIIIMTAPHVPHEHDPHLDLYQGLDKQAKIEAWAEAEDYFNAKMTVDVFPTTAPWGPARINWIINNANQNTAETDIFVSTTDWVVQFASANATVDVSEFYEKYGKNSMDPGVKAASTYKGGLYALPTSNVGSLKPYHGIVINLNMLERLKLENPAKLFNEGKWTWSNFKKYVEDATALLADDETVLSGKPAGLYYGMTAAAGLTLVDPNLMQLNFAHGYAVQAANLIRDLYVYSDKVWGDNAWDAENPSFNTGKSVFQVAEYWFIKDAGRFAENMWGEGTTRFGFVPFPYPDSISKEETRVAYQGGAIYQMTSGRVYPTGITAEDVYRVWTRMMLGTTARMHADPEMNEDVLMRRAAAYKLDDEESIEAITFFKGDKVIWDPYFAIVPSWQGAGPMIDAVVVTGKDYMSVVDEYAPLYSDALTKTFG